MDKIAFILLVVLLIPNFVSAETNTFISRILNAKFILIPSGTFMMGSPFGEPQRERDETQNQVTISNPFYIQTTEVTQGQWRRIMGSNPSHFSSCGDDCPVEMVSWNNVQDFILKLNSLERTNKYRLPTEAEWEYAARAGTTTPFYTGKCLSTKEANYNGRYPLSGCSKRDYRQKTIRVASLDPNTWGLYDMHGNVSEWVQDYYGTYPSDSVTDPTGPSSGLRRVIRGGSWHSSAGICRSASRYDRTPGSFGGNAGFRLVRTP